MGLAGLLQCDSICGHRRAFTVRDLLWASPDINGSKIAVGLAGLFVPDRMLDRMLDGMPDGMSDGMPDLVSEIK